MLITPGNKEGPRYRLQRFVNDVRWALGIGLNSYETAVHREWDLLTKFPQPMELGTVSGYPRLVKESGYLKTLEQKVADWAPNVVSCLAVLEGLTEIGYRASDKKLTGYSDPIYDDVQRRRTSVRKSYIPLGVQLGANHEDASHFFEWLSHRPHREKIHSCDILALNTTPTHGLTQLGHIRTDLLSVPYAFRQGDDIETCTYRTFYTPLFARIKS